MHDMLTARLPNDPPQAAPLPNGAIAASTSQVVTTFHAVLAEEQKALSAIAAKMALEPQAVADACATLLGSGQQRRVIVSGIGKAGLIARKVAATMSSIGTAATFLHPVEALHGDLGFVQAEDCGLLFSYSGETVELIRLAHELKRLDCPSVAVTRSRRSTLGRLASVCLETGDVQEACYLGLAPTSSTTVMLALGDALAVAVAKANGFQREDFARNHPAGALGLGFRTVEETMRTGDRLVCVAPETPLRDVVSAVTRARTGAAVVVNRDSTLLGIFTDGDLRRAILRGGDVLACEVRHFSSIPCHSIAQSDSVANALKLFQNTRTEDLPVVHSGDHTVVGLICLKDITVY